MTSAKKELSPSEAADWRTIDEHVQRQGLPREVTEALRRIRDPEARAAAEKELEDEQKAAAAKAAAAKKDEKAEAKSEPNERRAFHR